MMRRLIEQTSPEEIQRRRKEFMKYIGEEFRVELRHKIIKRVIIKIGTGILCFDCGGGKFRESLDFPVFYIDDGGKYPLISPNHEYINDGIIIGPY